MKYKLNTSQVQKTILAPSMQQSIEILLLPLAELTLAIEKELQENPLLEIDEKKKNAEDYEIEMNKILQQSIKHLSNINSEDDYNPGEIHTNEDDEESKEKPNLKNISLEDHLNKQLYFDITEPLEIKIGEFIIGNLNEDGYLSCTIDDIAQELNITDHSMIERILKKIQQFDPIGIASRNLKENLLIQVLHKFNGHSELAIKIINNHLDDLGHRKYPLIAKELKLPLETVKRIVHDISRLEPKPARKFRAINDNIYNVKADITITNHEELGLQVSVDTHSVPPLRINTFYQNLLKRKNLTPQEAEFLKEKIKNAILFIKSVEQRHHTVKEIGNYILENQREFFEKGPSALKPMILKDVALAINRNESTISRAIHGKYLDSPMGFYPLKFFFSQAISESNGENISNRSIKEELKELIEGEDKTKPLSDHDIQIHFEKKGCHVARRTIAKYRLMLNILPSHLRKT